MYIIILLKFNSIPFHHIEIYSSSMIYKTKKNKFKHFDGESLM